MQKDAVEARKLEKVQRHASILGIKALVQESLYSRSTLLSTWSMPRKFAFSACKADRRLNMSAIEILSVQASRHGPKVEDHDWKQRGELLTKKDSSEHELPLLFM